MSKPLNGLREPKSTFEEINKYHANMKKIIYTLTFW